MDFARWEVLARLARSAPSPHNTQPYRIRPISAHDAEIVLCCDRLLPAEDHGNRYVFSAFGVFARALELAGLDQGLAVVVDPIPSVEPAAFHLTSPPLVIGHARVTGPCEPAPVADLLTRRRTARSPYLDRPLEPAALAALRDIPRIAGHTLTVDSDPAGVAAVLHLNAAAIIDNLQIGPERREIEHWYRVGPTPVDGDGLWNTPLAQPAWEVRAGFAVPWLFQLPGVKQAAIWKHLRTQVGTRHVALLSGPFATWPELVAAGRLLMDLWLAMTRHGMYLHPFGSTLTNAHYARLVANHFQVEDGWLLFRFGHAEPPPAAPRLASVIA